MHLITILHTCRSRILAAFANRLFQNNRLFLILIPKPLYMLAPIAFSDNFKWIAFPIVRNGSVILHNSTISLPTKTWQFTETLQKPLCVPTWNNLNHLKELKSYGGYARPDDEKIYQMALKLIEYEGKDDEFRFHWLIHTRLCDTDDYHN